MKGKPFRDQDNRALHERRMKERARIVVTQKNIEYILAHQHDSREELARYLRQCKKELGHVPAQSEVIGGDLLALRFGSWATALNHCGYVDYKGPALSALPLERTAIFQAEYKRLSEQHVKDKEARPSGTKIRKKTREESGYRRRLQMSGGRGTFDGQHWREELLRKRTKEALERYPAGERRLHYNEEYKRQTLIYNQERDAKKRAKKERYEQRMRKQAEARNQKSAAKAPVTAES